MTLGIATVAEVRRFALRVLARHRLRIAGVLGLHGLAAACALVAPRLIGQLIDDLQAGTAGGVTGPALVICAAVAAQSVCVRFAFRASAALGERVLAELRVELLDHLLALPLATIERAGAGELVTRMTRDVAALSSMVRWAVPEILIAAVVIVVTLLGMAAAAPLLALVCVAPIPVLWLVTRWYLRWARDGYLRQNAAYAELTGRLSETLEGARTVEALGIQDRRLALLDQDIAGSYAAERFTLRLRSILLPIIDVALPLPVVLTLLVGGWLHAAGDVSIAAVTAATLYAQQLVEPVDQLIYWLSPLQEGAASLARILGIRPSAAEIDVPRPLAERGTAAPPDVEISLRGVSFGYTDGRDVLHDITLDVRRGERLAIVGPTGAGKSTLGRLIARIHRPRAGAIAVGGQPLDALPFAELRKQLALVTQDNHVFQGSLRDNLRLGKPDATDAELAEALRAVGLADWVSAVGLDVRADTGLRITPGQLQQLALARLLLVSPRALILDEATAALDPTMARQLEGSLAAVLEGRTVIAIAHRLHTARQADRVVVLEDGRIAEIGPHDELVRSGGSYAALWASWQGAAGREP